MHHLGRFCFKTRLNYPNNRPVINKFLSDFLCTEFEGQCRRHRPTYLRTTVDRRRIVIYRNAKSFHRLRLPGWNGRIIVSVCGKLT